MKRWVPEGAKPRNNDEDKLQAAVIRYLTLLGAPGMIFYMVPNAGKRTPAAGRRAKEMGLRAGVYDIAGVLPPDGTAWFLELKVKGGVVSPEQLAFMEDAERAGALHHIAFSVDSAVEWLVAIGAIRKAQF